MSVMVTIFFVVVSNLPVSSDNSSRENAQQEQKIEGYRKRHDPIGGVPAGGDNDQRRSDNAYGNEHIRERMKRHGIMTYVVLFFRYFLQHSDDKQVESEAECRGDEGPPAEHFARNEEPFNRFAEDQIISEKQQSEREPNGNFCPRQFLFRVIFANNKNESQQSVGRTVGDPVRRVSEERNGTRNKITNGNLKNAGKKRESESEQI